MTEAPTIRSLERGLNVMRALSLNGALTVSQCAQQTNLPRQTVSRILFFLEELGYVERSVPEKLYALSDQVLLLSEGVRQRSWISQIAKPAMYKLCREILWPVALAMPRNLELEIVAATDTISPLVMRPIPIGLHIPFATSISGRVYLAHCSDARRETILEAILATYPEALDGVDFSHSFLTEQLRSIKHQGFFCDHMPHKSHSSLAAPVYDDLGVKAVIDIRFPKKALSVAEATEQFSHKLMACASTISTALKAS